MHSVVEGGSRLPGIGAALSRLTPRGARARTLYVVLGGPGKDYVGYVLRAGRP
jgi:hypothetical protein